MDLELSIALGSVCAVDQSELLECLPELPSEDIANFLSNGYSDEKYLQLAEEILERRHTYLGWKNYMYCYTHVDDSKYEIVIDYICEYIIRKNLNDVDKLLHFFKLLYSCMVMTTIAEKGNYNWKFFNGRMWTQLDKLQVINMIRTRVKVSKVMDRLLVTNVDEEALLNRVTTLISRGSLNADLFCQQFEDICNDKDSVFCMKSCLYDIRRGLVRKCLPGDMCSLAGEVDPDFSTLDKNGPTVMSILSAWMGGEDVANSYMDILAGALSEFEPRYAVVNSGTGADGKSTFFHIVSKLFGSYCITMPGSGPSLDSKNPNEATPLAAASIGKRVCIATDTNNINKLLNSTGFKGMSGGDTTYIRRLYKETDSRTPRLKSLILINTNQSDIIATSIYELTRIRIVKWLSKRITSEDKDIVPKHQITSSNQAMNRFENYFINNYGACMMAELVVRHINLTKNNMMIVLCPQIRQWTKDTVCPKTILRFLNSCTEKIHREPLQEGNTSLELVQQGETTSVKVEDLYLSYSVWRKGGARFGASDPTSMEAFRIHLEFYYPISKRFNTSQEEELYIEGLRLKSSDNDIMTLLQGSKTSLGYLSSHNNILMSNTSTLTSSNGVFTPQTFPIVYDLGSIRKQ